jgi:hypothetical protein
MNLKRFTEYLLANRLRAVLIFVVISLIPVKSVVLGIFYVFCVTLAILYAAFLTLRKGALEGGVALAIVMSLTILKLVLVAPDNEMVLSPLMFWTTVGFWSLWVISNMLTWLFAVLLNRQMKWSAILQVAALGGVVAISVLHLVYPDIASWWGVQLTSATKQALSSMPDGMNNAKQTMEAINLAKYHMSGMIVTMLLLNAMIHLIMARWWEAAVYSPGMLRRELHFIRLSNLAGILFLLTQLLAANGNSVVLDFLPIVYLLFVCAGLSVFHYFLGLMVSPSRWFWLGLLYVVIFYTMPHSLMLVSMVGLGDIWFDLRKKLRTV